ncbi:MAG: hypothetical protein IPQ11_04005 [Bacteroidetes bacterium]|nr:hypothetical protein [Bacteroidota bacterium]
MADVLYTVEEDAVLILEHFAVNTEKKKELSDYGFYCGVIQIIIILEGTMGLLTVRILTG